jgi:hypothetical protein
LVALLGVASPTHAQVDARAGILIGDWKYTRAVDISKRG